MKIFQVVSLVIFGLFLLISVIIFAAYRSGGSSAEANRLIVWGTMSSADFNKFLSSTGLSRGDLFTINYVEKRRENFDREFIEALASNSGPDVIFLENDSIWRHKDKVFIIPFSEYSEREFKNNFLEIGEIFLDQNGIIALPVFVDPLVMYWNRDIFTGVSRVVPIRYWDELYQFSQVATTKDINSRITRSAVALGEFGNITNAKSILTSLFIQSGNPVFSRTDQGVVSTLSQPLGQPIPPAESALRFYTEFSDPTKTFNSWNRSLSASRDMFSSGDLAVYFGFASELFAIRGGNPYLNFDVAPLPLLRESSLNLTYGRVQGLAIVKSSRKTASAFNFINLATSREYALNMAIALSLPPARRDLLSQRPTEAFMSTFYDSAIKSRAWLDPNRDETDNIFRNMIESVTSGRASVNSAIIRATNEINLLFR